MAEILFAEVSGVPLSGVVLRTIREAIIDGRLSPGQAVNEAELAKQLGTSRAPIREAIRHLESEGLVSRVPYRGTTVTPLTVKSIEELQSFRRVLEIFAAEQIIKQGHEADIDQLAALVEQMESCVAAEDIHCMNVADVSFHTRIIELSKNELLLEVWQSYVQRIRRALALRNRANSDLGSILELHRDLLAAFRARDLGQVQRCYDTHGADLAMVLQHLFTSEEAS